MSKYLTLTLDLNNETTDEQRKKFYEKLDKAGFEKLPTLTTLWTGVVAGDASHTEIVQHVQKIVEEIASSCKIVDYDAALAISEHMVTVW
jgi:hypothetical protein